MSARIIQAGPAIIDVSFWRDRPLTYPLFSDAARYGALINAKKKPTPRPRPKPGSGY